ncbi:hypothetical protein [Alteribacter aurantiacus]|uniref:hypothetical protein n=1 Tax=Alteribacter aurantiacus TaxID=254410 RepID=UPI000400C1F4|nr:hypothetical protein [Alteribacter aurantiacus]
MVRKAMLFLSAIVFTGVVAGCSNDEVQGDACWGEGKEMENSLNEEASHPTPCFDPLFDEESKILVHTFPSDESFVYRETLVENMEVGIDLTIHPSTTTVSSGSFREDVKQGDGYEITKVLDTTVRTEDENDLVFSAKGTYDETYQFHISLWDPEYRFTDDEKVQMIEGLIGDIR